MSEAAAKKGAADNSAGHPGQAVTMDELFSAAECREHAVRGRLALAAHPGTIEEHCAPG
jgi:hypothetical protein